MATITITGNGHNSAVTLYKIHQGNCSFKKDTATFHSQVKLMQEALTSIGHNTQGADGKFGSNTLAAVKAFQKAKGLTADGYFGKNSLNALEDEIGRHLDPDNCGNQETGGGTGGGGSLSVSEYMNNLESFCNCGGSMVLVMMLLLRRSTAHIIRLRPETVWEHMAVQLNTITACPKRELSPPWAAMMRLKLAWRSFSRTPMNQPRRGTWAFTQASTC